MSFNGRKENENGGKACKVMDVTLDEEDEDGIYLLPYVYLY